MQHVGSINPKRTAEDRKCLSIISSEKIDPFEEKNEKCAHRSIQKSSSRFVSFFLLRVTSKSCVFRQFSFTFCIDICRSPSLQSQEDHASSLKRGERERARTHTF